ncbi:MAG: D-2-hydroxyacid dehydrogenase [Christensenellales bacterium]
MKTNILVLLPLNTPQRELLERSAPGCAFTYSDADSVDDEAIRSAHIMIGSPGAARLSQARCLKWLQLQSAGAEQYVRPGVMPEGAILTNASGAYGPAISEYMISVLLSMYKKLHLYRDNQNRALWRSEGEVRSIRGSTALILGLGDIGGAFARCIRALGGYTIGVRRADTKKPDYLDELYLSDSLDMLLPRADIVAMALPATPQTYRIMNARRLALLKPGSVLINVGRGTAVDTEALCDALLSGRLLGAALDVTDPEPLPAEHRMWRLPGAIITPHVAGGYHLPATLTRIVEISAENLCAFLTGGSMRNIVDFSTGYRKTE